jgi:hypothetical protein
LWATLGLWSSKYFSFLPQCQSFTKRQAAVLTPEAGCCVDSVGRSALRRGFSKIFWPLRI